MPKKSNSNRQNKTAPGPATDKEKQARLKEVRKLTTREMLLRIMETLGDERVSDDQLLRAVIILEGLGLDDN